MFIIYKHCDDFVMLETRFPSQVNASSITFPVIEEDTRPGFFGRAVLHISWARPEGQCVHVYPHTCSIMMMTCIACIVIRNRNKHCRTGHKYADLDNLAALNDC